jgi:hypothetical protein
VDFYWNYLRIRDHEKDLKKVNYRFTDVNMNFEGFFLKEKTKDEKIFRVNLMWNGRIGIHVAEEHSSDDIYSFESLF